MFSLATSIVLGEIIGSFVGGWVSSEIGRVRTIVLFGIPGIVSNICVAFAQTPLTIYIWCFIQGLSAMVCMTTGS